MRESGCGESKASWGSRLGVGGSTQERVEGRGNPTDISCGEKVAVGRVG